jgi:adenine-specific DNA-methyltransferase
MDNMNYIATHGPFVTDGPIQKKYSPKDTQNIQKGEPCFFTRENAIILDTLKEYVVKNIIVAHMYVYLGAIIRAALKHANIEDGHFQKYRKDKNGCGTFFVDDETKQPYKNVMDVIQLEMPEWYDTEVDCKINFYNKNILELIKEFDNNSLDVIFLDPPVNNQVHYRKHYKILNELARTRKTMKLKDMPPHSSLLYDRESAIMAFTNFIRIALKKTKYIIISFSPDGIISENDWINIVKETQVCIKMFQIRHKQKNNASTEEYAQPNTTKTNYELLYVLRNF